MKKNRARLPKELGVEGLIQGMPPLLFEPAHDANWPVTEQVQHYLNYYQINFSAADRSLRHGAGRVSAAGFDIACHYWMPPQPRGTLVVVHGYYDHLGIFGHAIAFGLQQGLAVLAFDLPGHGLSSGERAVIESFDQYGDVLQQVLEQSARLLPSPRYALGQSTGGATLLNHLWRYPEAFTRMALCAPLVIPTGWRTHGRILYALLHPFIKRLPRGRSRSSQDQAFIDFIDEQDALQSEYLSVTWVGAMRQWHKQFLSFAPRSTPVLLVQGTADTTVDWHYNLPVIQARLPQLQVVYIEGAGHQLVNEVAALREQVFTQIRQYFFAD